MAYAIPRHIRRACAQQLTLVNTGLQAPLDRRKGNQNAMKAQSVVPRLVSNHAAANQYHVEAEPSRVSLFADRESANLDVLRAIAVLFVFVSI